MKPRSFPVRQLTARPLACFCLCFVGGVILAALFVVPLAAALGLGIAALIGAIALSRTRPRAAAALAMAFALLGGMARATLSAEALPQVETRYSVNMVGRVVSEPFTNPNTGRVISQFQLENVNGKPSTLRLRLYLRGDEEALSRVDYGQRLSLKGHIWACDDVTNPYEFDFGEYLAKDGMAGYATAKIEDVTLLDAPRSLPLFLIDARRAVSGQIDRLFPRSAPLVRALIMGDRSLLSDEMRQAMNRTGTAHLISISGLHVSVLAFALLLLYRRWVPRPWATALVVALLTVYGAIIGFRPAFVRALVMFAIYSFAPVVGMPTDGVTRLAVAAMLWLMIRPGDVTEAGFALSYAASAGIILLSPPLEHLLGADRLVHQRPAKHPLARAGQSLLQYLVTLLAASLAAQLATLPAVVAWFGTQSLVSIPFNLICVPLCMAGYIAALAALAVSVILPAAGLWLAKAPEAMFSALTAITRFGGDLPVAALRIGRYPAALILVHVALMFAASELSLLPRRIRRFLPLTLVAVAALASLLVLGRAWPFTLTFLDAGQADCAVITTRGHTYLIDTGDTYTPAADYLSATCLHLDGVVLSHPHQDHAGGLLDVLDSFKPDALYIPAGWYEQPEISQAVTAAMDRAEALGIPIYPLRAGDSLALSRDCALTVYSPDGDNLPADTNDLSLLTLITCQGKTALFTGDLTAQGEPALIPDTDVLKVAHHGAENATSQRFVDACTPEIAIISVGENRFGHPSQAVLDRLRAAGCQVYQTLECGAIRLTLRRGEFHIDTFLEAVP